MSKGLESLTDLRNNWCETSDQKERAYDIIEKELKALEIIKNKLDANTICRVFGYKGYKIIKYFTDDDLLREVLKW